MSAKGNGRQVSELGAHSLNPIFPRNKSFLPLYLVASLMLIC